MEHGLHLGLSRGTKKGLHNGLNPVMGRTAWRPYDNTNIVGFSSISTQNILYSTMGNICFMQVAIIGTSNATSFTFDLPIPCDMRSVPKGGGTYFVFSEQARHRNNSSFGANVGGFSIAYAGNNCKTITVMRGNTLGTTWTSSGTKSINGAFWYPIESRYNGIQVKPFVYTSNTILLGWSSMTYNEMIYTVYGKEVFWMFNMIGTSNSASIRSYLPIPSPSALNNHSVCSMDNGAYPANGGGLRYNISVTDTLQFRPSLTDSGVYTASGTKQVMGQSNYFITS